MSSDDEELAKLMREIDAMNQSGPAQPPAPVPAAAPSAEVARTDEGRSPRAKWAGIAAIGGGVGGFLVGSVLWFLPYMSGPSTALGAALGAGAAAYLGGPPKWMGGRD